MDNFDNNLNVFKKFKSGLFLYFFHLSNLFEKILNSRKIRGRAFSQCFQSGRPDFQKKIRSEGLQS